MWMFDEDFEMVINLNSAKLLYVREGSKYEIIAEFDNDETYVLKTFKNKKDALDYIKELIDDLNPE